MTLQVLVKRGEDGYFVAHCPSLKSCWSQGKNKEEAIRNIEEAISLYLEGPPSGLAYDETRQLQKRISRCSKVAAFLKGASAQFRRLARLRCAAASGILAWSNAYFRRRTPSPLARPREGPWNRTYFWREGQVLLSRSLTIGLLRYSENRIFTEHGHHATGNQ